MTFIDKSGRRVTTESSYLTNDVLRRKNLTVAIHVGVTRVLFSNGTLTKKEDSLGLGASEVEPRAVGVEFAKEDRKEERFVVRAAKEVILWCVLAFSTHTYLSLLILYPLLPQRRSRTHSSHPPPIRYRPLQRTGSIFSYHSTRV